MLTDTRTFVLLDRLGKGGFGEVWRARMERQGFAVEVAVKLLHEGIDPRGDAAKRLRDEGRLLGLLRHRAIPRVLDLMELDGRLALVSELVDGADFDHCLRQPDPIGLRAGCQAISDVADALDAAWSTPVQDGAPLRLVHRDIKPSNIRVGRDGQTRLLDFGIAWTAAITRDADTRTGAVVGSPMYMAPERFDPGEPLPAADVYGLGCVLYELGARKRLWKDLHPRTVNHLMMLQERYERALGPRLRELPTDTPAALRDLIVACLQHDPARRPTARDLSDQLAHIVDTAGGPGLTVWCRHHPWPARASSGEVPRVLPEGRGVSEPTVSTENSPLVLPAPHQAAETADPVPWQTGELGGAPQTTPPDLPSGSIDLAGAVPVAVVSVGSVVGSAAVAATPAVMTAAASSAVAGWVLPTAGVVLLLAVGASQLPTQGSATRPQVAQPVESPPASISVAPPAPAAPLDPPVVPAAVPSDNRPATVRGPDAPKAATSPDGNRPAHDRAAPQLTLPAAQPAAPARPAASPPAPAPAASPPAPAAPPRLAMVRVAPGGPRVSLRCGDKQYVLPAEVPAGSCTPLVEWVPHNPEGVGLMEFAAGETATLRCANRKCMK